MSFQVALSDFSHVRKKTAPTGTISFACAEREAGAGTGILAAMGTILFLHPKRYGTALRLSKSVCAIQSMRMS
jgi:hypothetical protein